MNPSRREILRLSASMGIVCGISGCLGPSQEGTIGIIIENRDDEQHSIDIFFSDNNEDVYNNQYIISGGEETRDPDVVNAGEYTVSIILDSNQRTSLDFTMAGCDSNYLYVSIDEEPQIYAGVLDDC